jgi:hypothetical protein
MINWRRRLFRQHDPEVPDVRGSDVGFTGPAGEAVIDDQYRLAAIRAADTARARAEASEGWLRKIAKNAERGFDEIGDPAILAAVDKAFEAVASAMLAAADKLKNDLREIDGMEAFEDRFTKRRRSHVARTTTARFKLPGPRAPGARDNTHGDGWEMPPWPHLRLGLPQTPEEQM